MPRFTGIHHPAFATGNMEETIRFWRDLLGMRLVYSHGQPGYRQYLFALTDNTFIAFFEWPGVEKLPHRPPGTPVTGPFAFDHIAIGVASDDDLWDMTVRLAAAGFPTSDVIDHGFVHSLYSFDNNGIPIEFSSPANGIDIVHQPQLTDTAPSPAALEGSEPAQGHWPQPVPLEKEEKTLLRGEGWDKFRAPDS
jgi:catechol 2,3-dioxygenase-like lactoylglutathione lyase family enzyme